MAFFESTARLYVHLHPSCLNDPGSALQQELNAKLLQYDETLKGVVLSYDQVKIEDRGGKVRIFGDSHMLNVHVSVRLLLFSPKPGMKLVGEVNFTSAQSIGLLVHGIFNASIQEENIPESWEFYEEDDEPYWATADGGKVEMGTLVAFEVVEVRNMDDILSIQASILDEKKHGVVGKAEVPFAERHKVDAADALAIQDTPLAKQTPLAKEAAKSPKLSGKKRGKPENSNGASPSEGSDAKSAKKKSKKAEEDTPETPKVEKKKEKKDKSEKKEKKVKKEKKEKKEKS